MHRDTVQVSVVLREALTQFDVVGLPLGVLVELWQPEGLGKTVCVEL